MICFVQLEFIWYVWHKTHWGTVTKTKNINNLFGKPKKKVDIWKGSVHDVGLQPLER